MLQLLFESIEQTFGPYLSQAASLIYWSGLVFLAVAVVMPAFRVLMEYDIARAGLTRLWVKACEHCKKLTIVTGEKCDYCDEDLDVPWPVRLWTFPTRRQEGLWGRRVRWTGHVSVSVGFLLVSIWVISVAGALAPQGAVHKLFVGCSLWAMAAVGWFGEGAFRFGFRGLISRVRDAVLTLAAISVLALTLLLADAAKQTSEAPLARFTTDHDAAQFAGHQVGLQNGEIQFEYLQLDHELLGYHRIIPVSLSGVEQIPVPRSVLRQWAVGHLQEHAETYTAHGFTVRLRSDRIHVSPGHTYHVIERKGQVLIRRERNAPSTALRS